MTKILKDGMKTCFKAVLFVFLFSAFYFSFTTTIWAVWEITTLPTSDSIEYPSIALDSVNNPHISYYGQGLKYAKWTGSTWAIQTVDSVGQVGEHNSLALDSSNNPHISYLDSTNWDLKYAKWTGSAWVIQTVDSAGQVGLHPSLAIDSANNSHISYHDLTNLDLKYAKWTGSVWAIQTIDSAGDVSLYSSIALDSYNNPHISYKDRTISSILKYAKWCLPTISLSTATLNFSAIAYGGNPAAQTFSLGNSGSSGSTLSWTAMDNQNWLSLSPASGWKFSEFNCFGQHLGALD